MDTNTAEARYLDDQQWLDEESDTILAENERAKRLLAEGYCGDCAYGYNLFVGCWDCGIHSTKRICAHRDCMGGPCLTEYDT